MALALCAVADRGPPRVDLTPFRKVAAQLVGDRVSVGAAVGQASL